MNFYEFYTSLGFWQWLGLVILVVPVAAIIGDTVVGILRRRDK